MGYFQFGNDGYKRENHLDAVSNLINRWRTPTANQIREKLGEGVVETAFWVYFAALYNVPQKSGRPITRHPYDSVRRPEVRNQYSPTLQERIENLPHDLPEDILEKARGEASTIGVRPLVAAYVMLDILADVLGHDIVYGRVLSSNNGAIRYGGIISATNFNKMTAKPVLSDPNFMVQDNDKTLSQKKEKKANNGLIKYAVLTSRGRELFIQFLNEKYNSFGIAPQEIRRAYEFIKGRYQRFVDVYLPNSGLTQEQQAEIRERFVSRFVSTIEQKLSSGGIIQIKSLRDKIMANYQHIRELVASGPDKATAFILEGERPNTHILALETLLYWDYLKGNLNTVVEAAKIILGSGKINEEPYLTPIFVKGMDLTDNTAVMGPKLDDITSIHRKGRLFIVEGAKTLTALNQLGIPPEHALRVYHMLNYLLDVTKFKVGKELYDALREVDTMYDEDKEVLSEMRFRLPELEEIVAKSRPAVERQPLLRLGRLGLF